MIGHTAVFRGHLNNKQLDKQYDVELGNLKSNKCVIFVRELRNYIQHYKSDFVATRRSYNETGLRLIRQNLFLYRANLLLWKGWLLDSKAYMNEHNGDVDLKIVINEYHSLNTKFYDWFYQKVKELYSEELQELTKIELEIKQLADVERVTLDVLYSIFAPYLTTINRKNLNPRF